MRVAARAGGARARRPREPMRRPSASRRARPRAWTSRAWRPRSPPPRTSRASTRSGSAAAPRRARSPTPAASRCGSWARAATATVLEGALDLGEDESSVAALAVRAPGATALALRGAGDGLRVDGDVRLRDGAALRSSVVTGPVITAGDVVAHSVLIAGTGIDVESGALTARHLTVYGAGAVGVRIAPGALATVADSIVWGFARRVRPARSPRRTRTTPVWSARSTRASRARPPISVWAPARRWSTPATRRRSTTPSRSRTPPARCARSTGTATARRSATSGRSSAGRRHRRPRAATCWPTRAPSRAPRRRTTPRARRRRAGPAAGAFTSVRYGTVAGPFAFPPLDVGARAAAPATGSSPAGPRWRSEPHPGRRRLALGARDRRACRRTRAPVGAARRLPSQRGPRDRLGGASAARPACGAAASRSTR